MDLACDLESLGLEGRETREPYFLEVEYAFLSERFSGIFLSEFDGYSCLIACSRYSDIADLLIATEGSRYISDELTHDLSTDTNGSLDGECCQIVIITRE